MDPKKLGALALVLATALAAGAARAGDVEVTQRDKTFVPGEVTLKKGDTVVFHNDDKIVHNMFSRTEGSEFNLKLQKPGEDKRQTFANPGTVVVRCAIHTQMKLVVKVEE